MTVEEIKQVLLLPITDEERRIKKKADIVTKNLCSLGYRLSEHNPELKKIWYNTKSDTSDCSIEAIKKRYETDKEFGYWASESAAGSLTVLLNRLSIKKICDLGCGAAFVLKAMEAVDNFDIEYFGYDNEPELIKLANGGSLWEEERFMLKDITILERGHLPNDGLIYFWEPIKEDNLCKKFIDNLADIMYPNQLVAFLVSAYSSKHMKQNANMELITESFHGMKIYRKK